MSETKKQSAIARLHQCFPKEHNKTKKLLVHDYGAIRDSITCYADSVYNINKEILEGLNARYSSPKEITRSLILVTNIRPNAAL